PPKRPTHSMCRRMVRQSGYPGKRAVRRIEDITSCAQKVTASRRRLFRHSSMHLIRSNIIHGSILHLNSKQMNITHMLSSAKALVTKKVLQLRRFQHASMYPSTSLLPV